MRWEILIVALVLATGGRQAALALPSANECSPLSPAQIQKVIAQPFGEPDKAQAPPAFGKQPWGTHCTYDSQKGTKVRVDFIIYTDASAAEAKQTFERLMMWFPAKSKPSGIGDSAYIDSRGAIHVLKGKTRYFLSLDPGDETHLKDLASSVAAHL